MRIVLAAEGAFFGLKHKPKHKPDTYQNVNSVKSRHHVIDAEKDIGFFVCDAFIGIIFTWKNSFLEFVGVFEILDDHKNSGKANRDPQVDDQSFDLIELGRTNGHGYG